MLLRSGLVALVAAGCGDALVGGTEIDQLIGASPFPDRAAWEVRWVGPTGLKLACERVDARQEEGRTTPQGSVRLPLPELPSPYFQEGAGFRWALALPVLMEGGAARTPAGPPSLDAELGVWGTSAPLAWLALDGDREAAGDWLRLNGGSLPEAGWVEVMPWLVAETGSFEGTLARVDPYDLAGTLVASPLAWSDDEELDVWAGGVGLGGIAAGCVE